MIPEVNDRVAIVTGASRGLGRTMAAFLAGEGFAVVVASRTEDVLESLADEIHSAGGCALAVACDIALERDVQRVVERTMTEFGRVDVLVNNSGVVDSSPLLDQEPAAWDRVMNTNVRGTYLATRAVGRHMVAQNAGKIVNIASNFALMGIRNHAAYAASKAAVIAFTRSMAVEWAHHNIQVNAIAPGYFETDMTAALQLDPAAKTAVLQKIPARRMGEPEELLSWLRLLVGPESDFMTGSTIVIDGGQSAR